MSNSLADILSQKNFDEPPEIVAIKTYVQATCEADVSVLVRERDIVITCSSASLANTLRLKTDEIKEVADTTKRLVFRIR